MSGMFQLTESEKIIILGVCAGLLILTVVLTVCVVAPSCWIHICLKAIAKKRKNKYGNIEGLEEGTFIKLIGMPQYTVECVPPKTKSGNNLFQPDGIYKNGRKRQDSTYSSMSCSSQGNASVSNYSEASADASTNDIETDGNYGQITLDIWCRMTGDNCGELIVIVKEAQFLPPRPYGGICDPYVTFQLFRDKYKKRWSKSAASVLYEFRTTTKKKTLHPLFNEKFVMEISKTDLLHDTLKIAVFDDERYANDSKLGEISVPLKDFPVGSKEVHVFTADLLEPKQESGEIQFGLSYLPTAERLTFNIVKAQNLKVTAEDSDSFAPFVRVLLMHNGKLLKKKKTSLKRGTQNPVFNESLTFDVPPDQIDHVVFLVVASHRDPQDGSLSSPDSPTSLPNGSGSRKSLHIGKVIIGSCVRGLALAHWKAMKQSPRKQVVQWHALK